MKYFLKNPLNQKESLKAGLLLNKIIFQAEPTRFHKARRWSQSWRSQSNWVYWAMASVAAGPKTCMSCWVPVNSNRKLTHPTGKNDN